MSSKKKENHKKCKKHSFSPGSYLILSSVSRYCRRTQKQSTDFQSLHYKKVLLVTNFTAILVSMYCYWRHNTYCEPGMYSIFSLFEYTVVLSNMAYHFTSYYDFYNTHLAISILNKLQLLDT